MNFNPGESLLCLSLLWGLFDEDVLEGPGLLNPSLPGRINTVESYLEFHAGPHGMTVNNGTLESAIYGFLNEGELKSIRKSLFPEPLPTPKYKIPKRWVDYYLFLTYGWDKGCQEHD